MIRPVRGWRVSGRHDLALSACHDRYYYNSHSNALPLIIVPNDIEEVDSIIMGLGFDIRIFQPNSV